MTHVTLRVPVHATERPELVEEAVRRLFPDAVKAAAVAEDSAGASTHRAHDGVDWLAFEARDLAPFRQRIWQLRIIDAARGQMARGLSTDGQTLSARLSKQAALTGHVSFPARPHALGDIEFTLRREAGVADVLAWLCPETQDGEIVTMPGPQP